MKSLKPIAAKKTGKNEREHKVLFGLIDYYLSTGKPVGSNTLKDAGFEDLSSATIRNYFASLEDQGYLLQQHTSGGRIPTHKAFKLYAHEHKSTNRISQEIDQKLATLRNVETREIAAYLQQSAETLSQLTNSAVFLSAPRFDQDYVIDIKLVGIDSNRCLCILVTDFGAIHNEVLYTPSKLSAFSIKRIESYFHFRLTGRDKPENLEPQEESLAQKFYNEVMIRYLVGYSNFVDVDIHRTGFSKLLAYPEFQEPMILASSLSLFENVHSMRLLLKESTALNTIKFWIGDDLLNYSNSNPNCSIIAAPYFIGQTPVGAVGILGPVRMPYKDHFGILAAFCESISETLTRNIYKYKVSFRQPHAGKTFLLEQERLKLLENKKEN